MKMNDAKKVRIEFDQLTAWKAGTIVFAVLFIISLFTGGFKSSGNMQGAAVVQQPTQAPGQQPPAPVIKAEVDLREEPCIGDASADVTVIEFTDYQCPFCNRAFTTTFPEIKKLVDKGDVRYCVKDYPLPFHTEADEASVAANCAREQDEAAYWTMHDKLFENQGSWSGNSDPMAIFTSYAADLNLNEEKFAKCVADPKQKKEVDDDIAEGSGAGVSGTPTFYINGQQLVGAQPWAAFKTVIDPLLTT